jgi:DNA-binding NtrC family response regulator
MVMAQPPVRVLLAGDEAGLGEVLDEYLASRGHRVTRVADGRVALRTLRSQPFDVALLSIALRELDGLEVLRQAREEPTPPECIIFTGNGTLDMASAAMRLGAYDVMARPYQPAAIEALVRRAWEKRRLTVDNRRLASRLSKLDAVPEIRTMHPPLQAVLALAGRAAASHAALLIQGEPGTGKGALARALHHMSPRAAGPFVELAAATVAPARQATELFGMERGVHGYASAGLAEQAAGGTLFVAEVTQLESGVQVTLGEAVKRVRYKRVGATHKLDFDARLVASSSLDVAREARAGRVRAELAAALSAVVISLPPLRDRIVDIPALAQGFLRDLAGPLSAGLSADAIDALGRYHWPGNLRELRNVLERGVLLSHGSVVEARHLALPAAEPAKSAGDRDGVVPLAELERQHIAATLERTGWHQGRAADLLGISVKTLYRKIREYGFQRPGARA